MMKRVGAALLSAALMLSLLTTAAFAAGTTLTVKTPETIPKAGEEFTVTVDITGNPGLGALQFTLAFDSEAMECVDAVLSKEFSPEVSISNPEYRLGAIVAATSVDPMTANGTMAEYTFKAKKDIGAYGFSLLDIELVDPEFNDIPFSVENASTARTETTPSKPETTTPEKPETTTPTTPVTPETPAAQQTQPEAQGGETAGKTFPDAVGHWGEKWIAEAAQRGLFGGDQNGNFLPDNSITRGDFVLVLWRMAGKPEPGGAVPFADVPQDAYYAKAVAWAYEKGYVNGKGDGFAPKDSLTRQEAMKILFGYSGGQSGMELMLGSIYESSFSDTAEIASWAKPAMYWAVYNQIINGMNGGLNPKGEASRVQLAKILVEYQNQFETANEST